MEREKTLFYIGVNYVKDFYKMTNHYLAAIVPCGMQTPCGDTCTLWNFRFICELHKKNETVDESNNPLPLVVNVVVDAAKNAVVEFKAE